MTDGYLVNVQFTNGKTSSFYATYDGEWYYFMQDRFYRIKVDGINITEQEYRNYLDNAWYPVKDCKNKLPVTITIFKHLENKWTLLFKESII